MSYFPNTSLYYYSDVSNQFFRVLANGSKTAITGVIPNITGMMVTALDGSIFATQTSPNALLHIDPTTGFSEAVTIDAFDGTAFFTPSCIASSPTGQFAIIGFSDESFIVKIDLFAGLTTNTYPMYKLATVLKFNNKSSTTLGVTCDVFHNVYMTYNTADKVYGRVCPFGGAGNSTIPYAYSDPDPTMLIGSLVCDLSANYYILATDTMDILNPFGKIFSGANLTYAAGLLWTALPTGSNNIVIGLDNNLYLSCPAGLYRYDTLGITSSLVSASLTDIQYMAFEPLPSIVAPPTPVFKNKALYLDVTLTPPTFELFALDSASGNAATLGLVNYNNYYNMACTGLSNEDIYLPDLYFTENDVCHQYRNGAFSDVPIQPALLNMFDCFPASATELILLENGNVQIKKFNIITGTWVALGPTFSALQSGTINYNTNTYWIADYTPASTITQLSASGTVLQTLNGPTFPQYTSLQFSVIRQLKFDPSNNNLYGMSLLFLTQGLDCVVWQLRASENYSTYHLLFNVNYTTTFSGFVVDLDGTLVCSFVDTIQGLLRTNSQGQFKDWLYPYANINLLQFPGPFAQPPPPPPPKPSGPICLCPQKVDSKPNLFGSYNQPGWSNSNAFKYSTLVSLRAAVGQTQYVNNPNANGYCMNQTLEQSIGNKGGYYVSGYRSSRAPPRNRFG